MLTALRPGTHRRSGRVRIRHARRRHARLLVGALLWSSCSSGSCRLSPPRSAGSISHFLPPPQVTGFYTIDSILSGRLGGILVVLSPPGSSRHSLLPSSTQGRSSRWRDRRCRRPCSATTSSMPGQADFPNAIVARYALQQRLAAGDHDDRHHLRLSHRRRCPDRTDLRLGRIGSIRRPGHDELRLHGRVRRRTGHHGLFASRLSGGGPPLSRRSILVFGTEQQHGSEHSAPSISNRDSTLRRHRGDYRCVGSRARGDRTESLLHSILGPPSPASS